MKNENKIIHSENEKNAITVGKKFNSNIGSFIHPSNIERHGNNSSIKCLMQHNALIQYYSTETLKYNVLPKKKNEQTINVTR